MATAASLRSPLLTAAFCGRVALTVAMLAVYVTEMLPYMYMLLQALLCLGASFLLQVEVWAAHHQLREATVAPGSTTKMQGDA